MMHKFAAVLMVDYYGENWQATSGVVSKYCDVWVVI